MRLFSLRSHWKPPERTAKVDAIMAVNPELRDRETRGVSGSQTRYILDEQTVAALRERGAYRFSEQNPQVLYSAIDPSGGGSASDFAIVTLALNAALIPIVRETNGTNAWGVCDGRGVQREKRGLGAT